MSSPLSHIQHPPTPLSPSLVTPHTPTPPQLNSYCAGGPQDIPVKSACPPLTPFTNTTTAADPGACVGCTAGTSFFNGTCVVECAVGFYANSSAATSCTACEVR
jgi:hypothetical protein